MGMSRMRKSVLMWVMCFVMLFSQTGSLYTWAAGKDVSEQYTDASGNELVEGDTIEDIEVEETEDGVEDEGIEAEEIWDGAYNSNYKLWTQSDSSITGMSSGCSVVALAKLIYEANASKDTSFNPDVLYNWGNANGCIRSDGFINDWSKISNYAIENGRNFSWVGGFIECNERNIIDKLKENENYYIVISVTGSSVTGSHFVAVDRQQTLRDSMVWIYESNSWNTKRSLSDFNFKMSDKGFTPYQMYIYEAGKNGSGGNAKPTPAASNAKISSVYVDGVTQTEAVLHGELDKLQYVTSCGFHIEKADGSWKKDFDETTNANIKSMWFSMNKYYGNLSPGTTYNYYMKYNTSMACYKSNVSSFTTASAQTVDNSAYYSNLYVDGITSTDATIHAELNKVQSVTEYGVIVKKSDGSGQKDCKDTGLKDVKSMWFNMNKYYGSLAANTEYKYQFYYVCSAGKKVSDWRSFKTADNAGDNADDGNGYFSNIWIDELSDTDANLHAELNKLQYTTSIGVRVQKADDPSTSKICEDLTFFNTKYCNFKMSKYYGTLEPGTEYLYCFYYYNYASYVKTSGWRSFKTTGTTNIKSFTLSDTSCTLTEGDSKAVSVTIEPGYATNKNVRWSSNNNSVVTVENGLIRAVGTGSATITATTEAGGKTATVNVNVNRREVPMTGIILDTNNIELNPGEEKSVTVSKLPANTTDYTSITWSSDNNDVATVIDGRVKAVKSGTAVIKAMAGDKSVECVVSVLKGPTTVILDNSDVSLSGGDKVKINAVVSVDGISGYEASWSSSDSSVAIVDESGNVTAVSKGTCVITATAQDGSGVSASCTVNVKNTVYQIIKGETIGSRHPYDSGSSDIWVYTEDGAESITVSFSEFTCLDETTEGDYIEIRDADNRLVSRYYGTALAGKSVTVQGDTVRIQLVSDSEGEDAYGFDISGIKTRNEITAPDDNTESDTLTGDNNSDDLNPVVEDESGSSTDSDAASDTTEGQTKEVSKKVVTVPSIIAGEGKDTLASTQKISIKESYSKAVKFVSKNKNVATVNKKGIVTVKGGNKVKSGDKSVIKAYDEDGELLGEYTVTVTKPEVIKKTIKLSAYGESFEAISNINGTEKVPTSFESSNTKILSIDKETGTIITKDKGGTATITAYYGTGKNAAKYRFKVKVLVPKLNKDNLVIKANNGGKIKSVTLKLKNMSGDEKVTWKISDASIATVQNGKVTAKKEGVAIVSAVYKDREYKCNVSVSIK